MNQILTIYPKRGFLNSNFNIKSKESIRFIILFNGNVLYEDSLHSGQTKILPKLRKPGEYIISTINGKERQSIVVEDAIRLGNSELKNAYVFDNCPYIIFVMKDRIHFFDPTIESFIYSDNFLTPNDIKSISKTKLLFMTHHHNGLSISTFDIESMSNEECLECDEIITHSDDFQILYVKKENKVIVVNSFDLTTKTSFRFNEKIDSYNCWVNNDSNLLFCLLEFEIICIDINTGTTKISNKHNAIGITSNDYLIINNGYWYYTYEDMKPNSKTNGSFLFKPSFNKLIFKGHSISNALWENHFNKSNETTNDIINEFVVDCKKMQERGCPNNYYKKTIVISSSAILDFYPSEKGIYIIEDITSSIFNISYYVSKYEPKSYLSREYETKLIWLSPTGSNIEYNNHSYSNKNAIIINGIRASFALDSTKSAIVENGLVVEIIDGVTKASEKIKKIDEPSEDKIIISGEEIIRSRIVSKDKNVMLIKASETYILYKKMTDGIWTKMTTNTLKERNHIRAAMSADGKHLIYSKGGNQYALYNIEEDKEETVLTGNFVDFDKSGNLIFSDKPRQLRIYDPISFQWKNNNSEYYTFVSTDGKLYAKTSLTARHFNMIDGKEIDFQTFFDFKKKYDSNGFLNNEEQERRLELRRCFYYKFKSFFDENYEDFKDDEKRNNKLKTEVFFTNLFLKTKQFVVIGVVGTDHKLELELNTTLSYLNYVSFSYDNQFVAIVGKPYSNGYLKIVKIDFSETTNSLQLVDEICDLTIARKATWTCAFSKQGLFGTYDSCPNLYLIRKSDFSEFVKDQSKDYDYLKEHLCIPNRSLMCFSPSGKYMALSNQGYEPISLGGKGHVPSNEMFIYRTDNYTMIDEWHYQGEGISKLSPYDHYRKNLIQAGFSIDESKIMTVSNDGVIIVRNLHMN